MKKWSVLACAMLMLGVTGMAQATTIYTENFNNSTFQGSTPILLNDTSDNWSHTDYYSVNSADGWTFTGGGTYYATNGAGNGAILLNENGAATASTTITGLTAGSTYTLQFNVWGDNRPGQQYGLNVAVDGNPLLALSGLTDQGAGFYNNTNGLLESITFQAANSTALLAFSQNTPAGSPASPIIDNVTVAPVPEPSTIFLLGAGLAGLGFIRRRAKK